MPSEKNICNLTREDGSSVGAGNAEIRGIENLIEKKVDGESSSLEWILKIFISLFVIALGIILILFIQEMPEVKKYNWETPLSQLGLACILSGITYLVIQQVFEKGNREYSKKIIANSTDHLKQLLKCIQVSLDDLTHQNQILNGAIARNVQQIYARRSDGLKDIIEDIKMSKNIKMLGISLREYFVSSGHYFSEMDSVLNEIRDSSVENIRNIQILIINPYCEQATIRAEREADSDKFTKSSKYEDSGLYSDVWQTIRYLNKKNIAGKVESKVYNSAPTCFLVITDKNVYIEQYHYGLKKSGLVGGNFPLLRFPHTPYDQKGNLPKSVSDHLLGHFQYIWEKEGSSELKELLEEHKIGVSKSAWECRLTNLFTSRLFAEERIRYVLKNSKTIRLIGISLRDFLHAGKGFYSSIQSVNKEVIIQALLLDPLSEQGKLRSEREEPNVEQGNLYYEVITSIRSLERLKGDHPNISAKLYHAAPTCFAIFTDISVIIEQYHYGSADPGATILGGRIPVYEYGNDSSMYEEIKGHIDYIWNLTSIEVDKWKERQKMVGSENHNGKKHP